MLSSSGMARIFGIGVATSKLSLPRYYLEVATERAKLLNRAGDSPDLDTVLSEVEKMTGTR